MAAMRGDGAMQIGFYTAVFGDQTIEEIARWAAGAGFTTLEVDMNRHAGDGAGARKAVETVRAQGLDVCMITCFGNLLDPDRAARERTRGNVEAAVEVAAEKGVPLVCTFPGRDFEASEDDNYRQLAEYYGPLAERAARGNVK